MKNFRQVLLSIICLLMFISIPEVSLGLIWVGENGIFRISFSETDPYDNQLHPSKVKPDGLIHLWGWLTEVDPIQRNEDELKTITGFELGLDIVGCDFEILDVKLPEVNYNLGKEKLHTACAIHPGVQIVDGTACLVEWEIRLITPFDNVTIGMAKEYNSTCTGNKGCRKSGTYVSYMGGRTGDLGSVFFGAGYVPALISSSPIENNEPFIGKDHYSDIGLFEKIGK